jgi:hypothetical protein
VELIVGDFVDAEIDRGGARSFGVGGHTELFLGGRLKLGMQEDGRGEGDEWDKSA